MKRFLTVLVTVAIFFPVPVHSAVVGDINQDGKIDLMESIYALQVASGVYPTIDDSCLLTGQGAWIDGKDYNLCDVVTFSEITYACADAHGSIAGVNEPPDPAYWTVMSIKGDTGPPGADGITSESDPTVLASVKDGISWSEVNNRPAGLDDGDDIGISSETDPTVLASVKDGISWSEVSNRPAGLDDGDDIGITSEADPQVGNNTLNYIPKWDGTALVEGSIYNDSMKIGVHTTTPEASLDIVNYTDGFVVNLRNYNGLALDVTNEMGFKTGNYWTGLIKTLGTGTNRARMGFFTYASSSRVYLIERVSISDTGNVGIGTTSPGAKLEVNGQVKITGGSPGAGKILISDASGLARWVTPGGCAPGINMTGVDNDGNVICSSKVVFLTSEQYNGNLGGIPGADKKCQELASAAGLPGQFKAWLATDYSYTTSNNYEPPAYFNKFGHSYKSVDGTLIAENWIQLVDTYDTGTSLLAPINQDQNGTLHTNSYVWTGTGDQGQLYNDTGEYDCANWNHVYPDSFSIVGSTSYTHDAWCNATTLLCEQTAHLYCFEQ